MTVRAMAARLARAFLAVLALGASVVCAVALYRYERDVSVVWLVSYLVAPAVAALVLGMLAASGSATRVNGALLAASTIVGLYIAEMAAVVVFRPRTTGLAMKIARDRERATGIRPEVDERSVFHVVDDLRRSGEPAYPMTTTVVLDRLPRSGVRPLGGIARVTTVACNELGEYMVFRSDEHGFNNPTGQWVPGDVDIALIGDSFTFGMCVPQDRTLAGVIRETHPRTISLGLPGAGPLLELAAVREYLPALRPRTVFWIYFENDFRDLRAEARRPDLMRYLDPHFSQDLLDRQPEIDRQLRGIFDAWPRSSNPLAISTIRHVSTFTKLRRLLDIPNFARKPPEGPCCDLALFETILREASAAVGAWNGRFVFVFLPAGERYRASEGEGNDINARDDVLMLVRSLGIPVVDVHEAFRQHPNSASLYADPNGFSHFNVAGYRLAGETILRAGGEVPPLRPLGRGK